jgi:fused signal recognition particle receptor
MAIQWFKKSKKAVEESADEGTNATPHGGAAVTSELSDFSKPADSADGGAGKITTPPAEKLIETDETPARNGGFFARLKRGLTKTRQFLTTDIDALFFGGATVDKDFLDDLEGLLIGADLGVHTTTSLIGRVAKKAGKIKVAEELKAVLREEILSLIPAIALTETPVVGPRVVMVVGVNGVGKTTTIGKLAARATAKGEKVLIAAADTFRAAAVEQLEIWANRAGADFVRHRDNADPAAVAYDGYQAGKSRGIQTVFIDTAGRLHTKVNLMEELKKIKRTLQKIDPNAPHEVLLVLDATTGQNALSQAKLFHEACGVTSLALTKLDGTAKGGVVISICHEMNIPLRYIGVGESIEDLQIFDPEQFVKALI